MKNNRSKFSLFLLSLIIFGLSSCEPVVNYDEVPEIKFEDYVVYNDSDDPDTVKKGGAKFVRLDSALTLTISFIDGDGDLGMDAEGNEGKFNMFAVPYELIDGKYQTVSSGPTFNDTIIFPNSIPNLTPTGKNKAIKGLIEVDIKYELSVFNFPSRNYGGKVKFEIWVLDRAENKSNVVVSPPISYDYNRIQ